VSECECECECACLCRHVYVFVCVCVWCVSSLTNLIYTHIHTYTYIHTCTYMHTYTRMYICTHIHTHTHTCTHAHIHTTYKYTHTQIIVSDSPELLGLLDSLSTSLREVKQHLEPLLARLKEGGLPTCSGLSFLEAKHQLLLSYCTNIAFYIVLKSEGRRVEDHPVVERLVHVRTLLEKMKVCVSE